MQILLIYLIVINIAAFVLYGADKRKAQRQRWRIPEKTLLGIAVIGGSVGALAGMLVFRHKTLHNQFRFGLPAILAAQIVLAAFLIARLH